MGLGLATILEILGAMAAFFAMLSGFLWLITRYASKFIFDRLLAQHKSDLSHTLEAHKMRLKKSEFLFQKEFDATSEIIAIIREVLPRQNIPDMDWHDACEEIAHNFAAIEKRLDKYLANHGAALDDTAVSKLIDCIRLAATGKFEIHNGHVNPNAIQSASDLCDGLRDVEEIMLKKVRSQSIT